MTTNNNALEKPAEQGMIQKAEPANTPAIQRQPAVVESLRVRQAEARNDAVARLLEASMANAGGLELEKAETKALIEDFPDDAFQQGAGGKENLIYIEHASLRERFNNVLGMGQWVLVVRDTWNENFVSGKERTPGIRVYCRAMLIVRKAYVGEAVGEMEYYPSNAAQNYGDAFEGAKTAAFRRCAKEFGVGLQAWKKDWCEAWMKRHGKKAVACPKCGKTAIIKGKAEFGGGYLCYKAKGGCGWKCTDEAYEALKNESAKRDQRTREDRDDNGNPEKLPSQEVEDAEIVEPGELPPMKTGADLEREVNAQLDNPGEVIEVVEAKKEANGQFLIRAKDGRDFYTKKRSSAEKAWRAKKNGQKFTVTADCIADGGEK